VDRIASKEAVATEAAAMAVNKEAMVVSVSKEVAVMVAVAVDMVVAALADTVVVKIKWEVAAEAAMAVKEVTTDKREINSLFFKLICIPSISLLIFVLLNIKIVVINFTSS
jgi:hypothetical protein